MKRQTSVDAYIQITREGLLSERRLQTYQILYKYGPMTAAQLVEKARTKMKVSNSGNFGTRLSELRNVGVAREVKTDFCPLTGRKVIFWDVTKNIPVKLEKKLTSSEKIKRLKRAFILIRRYAPKTVLDDANKILRGEM